MIIKFDVVGEEEKVVPELRCGKKYVFSRLQGSIKKLLASDLGYVIIYTSARTRNINCT